MHPDACEPWGYVAPAVAAVVTRATGVRHIYLIIYIKILSRYRRCAVDCELPDREGDLQPDVAAELGGEAGQRLRRPPRLPRRREGKVSVTVT